MKILQITERYLDDEVGGAQKSVQILAEGLARRGVEVAVCAVHEGSNVVISNVNGVRVYKLPIADHYRRLRKPHLGSLRALRDNFVDAFQLATSPELDSILAEEKPQIVHSNILSGFSVYLWQTAARHGCGLVHTVRDYYLRCARSTMYKHGVLCRSTCPECRVLSFPKKAETRRVDAVVGISRKVLDDHLSDGYFPTARISRVIPNSVGLSGNASSPRAPVTTRPVKLGFIGRLVAAKGIELLLREFRLLGDEFQLLIAGTGDPEYVTRLKAMGGENVTFLERCNAEDFYQQIDLLIVPSLWDEPFGRVVIEGFSFGLPVIVSNRGALPELVLTASAGAIFDPESKGALACCIHNMAGDAANYSQLSKAAIQSAADYSDDTVTAAYQELYQELRAN